MAMKPKHKRLSGLLVAAVAVSCGAGLILYSFSEHLVYFYTPTQLASASMQAGQVIRLGGLVEVGSVQHPSENITEFTITDMTSERAVYYKGSLPGLFKEGQGVIAEGTVDASGVFQAQTILAKHDENYLPPEVVKELKASGQWQDYSLENKQVYEP